MSELGAFAGTSMAGASYVRMNIEYRGYYGGSPGTSCGLRTLTEPQALDQPPVPGMPGFHFENHPTAAVSFEGNPMRIIDSPGKPYVSSGETRRLFIAWFDGDNGRIEVRYTLVMKFAMGGWFPQIWTEPPLPIVSTTVVPRP
jgi:hypothetical protein